MQLSKLPGALVSAVISFLGGFQDFPVNVVVCRAKTRAIDSFVIDIVVLKLKV